jgi:hypothetical protein
MDTLNSLPGNSVSSMRCTLSMNLFRTSVFSWVGCNRSYSSRMSPLSLRSSCGSNVALRSSLTSSRMSEEWYGTRLRPRAPTFVSNLHLVERAGLRVGMVLFASEATERGEWLPNPPLGEGERERVSYFRATCRGVEGTEFECCETIDGRWTRANVPASSRLLPMFGVTPFDVMAGALDCTLHLDSLFPSAMSFGAGAGFTGGFLDTVRAESRCGGGLREWGDTMTAGRGVCEAAGCSSSMRASCRNGCSSR